MGIWKLFYFDDLNSGISRYFAHFPKSDVNNNIVIEQSILVKIVELAEIYIDTKEPSLWASSAYGITGNRVLCVRLRSRLNGFRDVRKRAGAGPAGENADEVLLADELRQFGLRASVQNKRKVCDEMYVCPGAERGQTGED